MAQIDIFNGDADGLCALVQLRLHKPCNSRVVTGVKRDIALVGQANIGAGDDVVVLDISFDKNRAAVVDALSLGANVFYVDHHFAGDVPAASGLQTLINPAPDSCTSLLINGHLQGQFAEWAIVGAFGDNLNDSARRVAATTTLSADDIDRLAKLGVYLNYNGYGSTLEDLHFPPALLFEKLRRFASPLDFMTEDSATFTQLESAYHQDMASASALQPIESTCVMAVYSLPNEKWARRVSGVYSNDLANAHPDRAHAVLTKKDNGNYLVSIRAPLNNKVGADEVVRQFATGGGRKAAAGINDLPERDLPRLIEALTARYQ